MMASGMGSEAMSETTERRMPAVGETKTVVDSLGRKLTVRELDLLEEMDVIEAAGPKNAQNARWMMYATLAACVRDIDGVPSISSGGMLRGHLKTVGSEGINAVIGVLTPAAPPAGDGNDVTATAKN